MSRKRIFVLILVVVFLFNLQLVFAGGGGKGKKVTIKFMAALYSDATTPFWNDLIAAFEKEYPNVNVELDVVNWDNVYQKATTWIHG